MAMLGHAGACHSMPGFSPAVKIWTTLCMFHARELLAAACTTAGVMSTVVNCIGKEDRSSKHCPVSSSQFLVLSAGAHHPLSNVKL